jgi:hypothetical protein
MSVSVALVIQHAPYYHLWPDLLYNIFFKFPHKRLDFRGKNLLSTHYILFPLQIFMKNFLF